MAAVLAVFILTIPGLGTEDIGKTLEWVFYVTLPNFCFSKALQDLLNMHQFTAMCGHIGEGVCDHHRGSKETHPCCPGESHLLLVSAPKLKLTGIQRSIKANPIYILWYKRYCTGSVDRHP